jgi:hypothetical protein
MRKDDTETKHYFQSDRFFRVGDEWWFTAREGTEHGPFRSQEHAQKELSRHIETIEALTELKAERENRQKEVAVDLKIDRSIWDRQEL